MKKIKTIIFDMDGLLINSELIYKKSWGYAFKKENLDPDKSGFDFQSGQSLKVSLKKLEASVDDKTILDNILQDREEYIKNKLLSDELVLKPYVKETLETCRNIGLTTCLATSTFKGRSGLILDHLRIEQYFKFKVFGDEIEHPKPDPSIYLTVISKSNANKTNTIAVEDSLIGATAAKKAGIDVVLIPDSDLQTSYTISQIQSINPILYGHSMKSLLDELKKEGNNE